MIPIVFVQLYNVHERLKLTLWPIFTIGNITELAKDNVSVSHIWCTAPMEAYTTQEKPNILTKESWKHANEM